MKKRKRTKTAKDCHYYVRGGHCASKDAPNPNHSWCIGRTECGSYEVEVFEVK